MTRVALSLAVVALVAATGADCGGGGSDAPPTEPGTVVSRSDQVLPDGRTRATIVVEYPDGARFDYRLDGSTACVVDAVYPACAG